MKGMKLTSIQLQKGSELIEIFIKHPVQYLPVLKKNKIIGYISKKKVFRQSTDQVFLDQKITGSLTKLMEGLSHDLFFQEIETGGVKSVAYLLQVADRLEFHKKNKKDFLLKHKPVENISVEDIADIIEEHAFPMIICDGNGGLLMENIAAKKIRSLIQSQGATNPFLNWIKKSDLILNPLELSRHPRNVGKKKIGNKTYHGYKSVYHIQSHQLKKGWVNMVIFLSFQKKTV